MDCSTYLAVGRFVKAAFSTDKIALASHVTASLSDDKRLLLEWANSPASTAIQMRGTTIRLTIAAFNDL